MNRPPAPTASIRDRLADAPEGSLRFLHGAAGSVCLGHLLRATSLGRPVDVDGRSRLVAARVQLAGRSVLIATRDQLATALALIELDGVARRLIVCTPDLPSEHLPAIVSQSDAEAIVSDGTNGLGLPLQVVCDGAVTPAQDTPTPRCRTEWVLLTSGTTGAPKLLVHSFASLTAPIDCAIARSSGSSARSDGQEVVWGTFYDIRRYGGLQIFFRALLGRGSLVLHGASEPIGEFLQRLGAHRVTHISGTPSHWRRALMSPHARAIAPRYIRLSGEIADQGILNALRSFYPHANVGHAFASTEAGVGFEVNDGLEGFPASIVGTPGDVEIKIIGGSLRIRSTRSAVRYLGEHAAPLVDREGFVDTGDMVERRGDRCYFLGRRTGIINVGGLKVHPEEVEAAINRHPAVRMSMVRSTRSRMTGSLVAADVVLKAEFDPAAAGDDESIPVFKRQIIQLCRDQLAPHKIPATIRFVPALELGAAGKLARHA